MALYFETPLVESELISQVAGCRVSLKLENVQNSGSFKIRGVGNLCVKEKEKGCTRLISSSGGNAGVAAAYAGRKLGIPVTVIVPRSAPDLFLRRIQKEGANVIVHGETWTEANEYSLNLASQPELNRQLHGTKPDAIILSVGGGGLLNGVVQGLQTVGWVDVPVVAVETEGADSFAAACKAGKLVTLPDITSIAKCLGAKTVSQRSWDLTKEHPIHSCVVSDKATIDTCLKFLDDHHHAVDPACGAALAAVYHPQGLHDLQQQGKLPTTGKTSHPIAQCGRYCVWRSWS